MAAGHRQAIGGIPPDTLPAGSTININPAIKDSCVLNKVQVIAAGASLNIVTGSHFILPNGIVINAALPSLPLDNTVSVVWNTGEVIF